MRGDFDEDEDPDFYPDAIPSHEPSNRPTFDLEAATALERGLYNICQEVERLPASPLQTRLVLMLSTAMIELWRMRHRLANHVVQCPSSPSPSMEQLAEFVRRWQDAEQRWANIGEEALPHEQESAWHSLCVAQDDLRLWGQS
jgi:hypothetical protein